MKFVTLQTTDEFIDGGLMVMQPYVDVITVGPCDLVKRNKVAAAVAKLVKYHTDENHIEIILPYASYLTVYRKKLSPYLSKFICSFFIDTKISEYAMDNLIRCHCYVAPSRAFSLALPVGVVDNAILILTLGFTDAKTLPNWFNSLKGIEIFNFSCNKLTNLSLDFAKFDHLTELRLDQNEFKLLPDSLCQLTNLIKLDVSNNHLSRLPVKIGKLQALEELKADANKLLALPNSFGRLTSLVKANLCNNYIENLPVTIGDLQSLAQLDFATNQLIDLPDSFSRLTQLLVLNLGMEYTIITTPKPNVIKKATRVFSHYYGWRDSLVDRERFVVVSGNTYTLLPMVIGFLYSLTKLVIDRSDIEQIPDEFCQLTNLQVLDLQNNRFERLPVMFGELTNLRTLNLKINKLKSIPNISKLTELQRLSLYHNKLVKLHESICELTQMKRLCLDANDLEQLPSNFYKLRNMPSLSLNANCFKELPKYLVDFVSFPKIYDSKGKLSPVKIYHDWTKVVETKQSQFHFAPLYVAGPRLDKLRECYTANALDELELSVKIVTKLYFLALTLSQPSGCYLSLQSACGGANPIINILTFLAVSYTKENNNHLSAEFWNRFQQWLGDYYTCLNNYNDMASENSESDDNDLPVKSFFIATAFDSKISKNPILSKEHFIIKSGDGIFSYGYRQFLVFAGEQPKISAESSDYDGSISPINYFKNPIWESE